MQIMDNKRSYYKIDTPVNTNFERSQESFETATQKQQNQLRNIALSAKFNNLIAKAGEVGNPNASSSPMLEVKRDNTMDFNQNSASSFTTLKNFRYVFDADNMPPTATTKDFQKIFSNVSSASDLNSKIRVSPRRMTKMRKSLNDSDDNDTDRTSKTSPRVRTTKYSDTVHNKGSSFHSYQRDSFIDDKMSNSQNISSSLLEAEANSIDRLLDDLNTTTTIKTSTWSQHLRGGVGDMNFIMLFGLFAGLIISKALQYLQLYFSWFLQQVMQLRNALLGTTTVWEFLNFEDSSRFQVRTKILLLPIILACGALYGLVSVLHFSVRFLLASAPSGLTHFVQKLHN